MSTPRHDCKTDDRKLAIDRPCSACSAGDSEMEYHDHCPPFREGVAAPLEPSKARQWLISGGGGHEDGEDGIRACTMPMEHAIELMDEFAEFHAAAVSKNLTDKYVEMEAKWMRELLTVSEEIGEARDRISQAEGMIGHYLLSGYLPRMSAEEAQEWLKEIAALREKP